MAAASIASEAGVADVHMLDDAGDPVPTDSLLLEVARRPLSLVIGEQQLPVSACKGTVGHASADEHRVHLQVLMRKANYMRVRKILESDTRRQIKFSVRPKQRRGGDPPSWGFVALTCSHLLSHNRSSWTFARPTASPLKRRPSCAASCMMWASFSTFPMYTLQRAAPSLGVCLLVGATITRTDLLLLLLFFCFLQSKLVDIKETVFLKPEEVTDSVFAEFGLTSPTQLFVSEQVTVSLRLVSVHNKLTCHCVALAHTQPLHTLPVPQEASAAGGHVTGAGNTAVPQDVTR